MKSAYELAMERLEKQAPGPKLTDGQRALIAEIDNKFKAKIAEKEVFLGGLIAKARAAGDGEELTQIEEQLASEVRRLRDKCEREKEKARQEDC